MITDFFSIGEMVCSHVYDKYGERAWRFFDNRLLIILETLRDRINKPVFINSWQVHGEYSQRGLRCPQCQIVKDKVAAGELYMSAHTLGKAIDFDVEGLLSEEVRIWLIKNSKWWPYPFRLESKVNWCHTDTYHDGREEKVYTFVK